LLDFEFGSIESTLHWGMFGPPPGL
jgi:hypothetical protein